MGYFFVYIICLGLILQLYFIGFRRRELMQGRMGSEELLELWKNQRRIFILFYLFGGIGIVSLWVGASELRALSLAALTVFILLAATRGT